MLNPLSIACRGAICWIAGAVLLLLAPIPLQGQTTVIWREGFESLDFPAGWAVQGEGWQVGTPLPDPSPGPGGAFEGRKCAGIGFSGTYAPNLTSALIRETPFLVPPAELEPQLQFFHWREIHDDRVSVQISVQGGAWKPLATYTGNLPFWNREFIDLSPYGGSSAQIRFLFESNGQDAGSGWWLDEISVVQKRDLVTTKPTIAQQPSGGIAQLGSSFTLSVIAGGTGPFSYQWRLNGANIPGETNQSLVLQVVEPKNAGDYTVLVANEVGVTASEVARLSLVVGVLPFRDAFASSQVITNHAGIGTGSNGEATHEVGEPRHAGKVGTKSLWLTWRPLRKGVATFSTQGSDFDTLLAVYTGNELGNLKEVASDDDSGGYFTSAVVFSADPSVEYHIAVGGALEASGTILLRWDLELLPDEVPQILRRPQGVVYIDAPVVLEAEVDKPSERTYQWLFEGQPVPGANAPRLVLDQVKRQQVGAYSLEIRNGTQVIRSEPVNVEIGSRVGPPTADKLADLFQETSRRASLMTTEPFTWTFMPVRLGSLGWRVLNNAGGTTETGEPLNPQKYGGASRLLGVELQEGGLLTVDTTGSAIDTLVGLYHLEGEGTSWLDLSLVASDTGSLASGHSAMLTTNVTAGRYLVVVDGVSGALGEIRLSWSLGEKPQITHQPEDLSIAAWKTAVFQAEVAQAANGLYQWYRGSNPIVGATNRTLQLEQVQLSDSGVYYVRVWNDLGESRSADAILNVLGFPLQSYGRNANGQFQLTFSATPGTRYGVEVSTDLVGWRELGQFPVNTNTVTFVDVSSSSVGAWYYRIRVDGP